MVQHYGGQMPKAEITFKFDLEKEDDKYEYKRHAQIDEAYSFMHEFDAKLRQLYKYNEKQETTWLEVRELWYTIMRERELDWD